MLITNENIMELMARYSSKMFEDDVTAVETGANAVLWNCHMFKLKVVF